MIERNRVELRDCVDLVSPMAFVIGILTGILGCWLVMTYGWR